jgi:hypothetical protein
MLKKYKIKALLPDGSTVEYKIESTSRLSALIELSKINMDCIPLTGDEILGPASNNVIFVDFVAKKRIA